MDCQFTEQISLLMDGELSDAEAREVNLHLSACAICQQAQADFLLLRQQIQAYQPQADLQAQRQVLQDLLKPQPTRFWRKQIALPVPAFALLLLALAVVSLWALASRSNLRPQPTHKQPTAQDTLPSSTNRFDLSKFDQGERAVIYTVSRTPRGAVPQ